MHSLRNRHCCCFLAALLACTAMRVGAQAPAAVGSTSDAPPRRQAIVVLVSQSALVRASLLQGAPSEERAVAMRGLDVVFLPARFGFGAHARLSQSSLGGSDLSVAEVGLTLGAPLLSVEATFAQRSGYSPATGLMHDESYPYTRLGVRSQRQLWNSRFTVFFRGGVIAGTDAALPEPVEGWDGETQVAWTMRRVPVRAMLGYRLERFAVAGMEQEVSAMIFGLGLVRGMPK